MSYKELFVDGSVLEGGGQILRMALALSALQGSVIRVNNIRAGRDHPGLRAQHLKGVEIAKDLCKGKVWGAQLGSTEITFHPGKLLGGDITADTQTAGSVGLLIQVALPCALFASSPTFLHLYGGTNADMAPQIDYTVTVFKHLLEKFGASFKGCVRKRGYFPRGGGNVEMTIQPVDSRLKSVEMCNQGQLTRIWGRAFVAGSYHITEAHNMADLATRGLQNYFNDVPIEIAAYKESPQDAKGNGAGINIFAETNTGCMFGASALGKRKLNSKEVAQVAVQELVEALKSGACVDLHAQDQMIILMALADGTSRVKCGPLTLHTQTAIHVAKLLTAAEFSIESGNDGTNIINCKGIAFARDNSSPMEM